jgi:hypothetical protein
MDVLYYERITTRYHSNIPIMVQLKTWNPFVKKDAKLLDFSLGGFRIEFIDVFRLREIEKIVLIIPLNVIDPQINRILKLKADIKWYDPLHKQVGGTYEISIKTEQDLIEKIIFALAHKPSKEQK